MRISTRSNIATDDTVLVSFNPAFVVRAGETETIDLVVELATWWATTGAEHAFSVVEIESSSNLVGATARTNLMRVGSYAVQTVTFAEFALAWGTQYNVSETDVLLWEFDLQTTGDRDNVFKSITFRNAGTADLASAVDNLAIYSDGQKVSTNVSISWREVTFTVNSEIENGRTENYQVRWDILSADRNNDTINLEVRYSTDLVVVEKTTSFSAPVAWIATAADMGTAIIIWGDLLLSRDTSIGLNQTVSASTNDVVVLATKFNANEAVTLEDVVVTYLADWVGTSTLYSLFSNLRLVVNGKTVATYTPANAWVDIVNWVASTFNFDASFTTSDLTTIQIIWNVKNNAPTGSTFNIATFAAADLGSTSARYVSNDETATINGSAQWVNLAIANATLTLTRNDAIDASNNTVVSGASDVTLLGFSARANDVSDVRVTAINATATYGGAASSTDVNNVRLYQWNTLLATRNNFDFTGLNVTIPQNSSVSFKIVADFTNTLTAADDITLNITANNVSARNVSSNQTVTHLAINGQTLDFVAGGSADVTLNSSTAQTSIVVPSNSEASVLKFDIEAEDDNLRVTDLYINEVWAWNVDLTAALKSASIVVDGRTIEGTVIDTDLIYFSIGNTNPIVINKDVIKTLDLKVAFNDSSERTDLWVQFEVDQVVRAWVHVSGTSNGMRIVSEANGDELTLVTAAAVSNTHLLARSKPTVAMSSFTSSTTDLYKFSVTADSNRKITLTDLTMWLAGSADLTGATVTVYKDSESAGNTAFTLTDAGILDTLWDVANREVAAGTTNTYLVKITGATPANESIREARVTELEYQDDVTTPAGISTSTYNVWVPTPVASYKY